MSDKREKVRSSVFLGSIILHSVLSTCDRLRTACGFIKNKKLRGIGYNGSVSGQPHCDDDGHLMVDNHCVRTRHGEKNAISNTDRQHIRGSEAVVIATPCVDCMKDLIEEGVRKISYVGNYDNAKGKEFIEDLARNRGVELRRFEIDFADLFQELFDMMAQKGGVLYRKGYTLNIQKVPFVPEPEKKAEEKNKGY